MKRPALLLREKERLNALKSYRILDSGKEKEFNRITELASLICGTPMSLITLIDEKRQWFKASVGVDITETPRELAFCQYTILDAGILEVEDTTKDERFKDNIMVTGEPNVRFYAGYPLIDRNGHALGALCVVSPTPHTLNEAQKKALKLLAEEAMELIIERRRKAEARYFDSLYQLSNDLICIAGLDGYFKKVNPAFQKVLGWSTSVLLHTSFLELIHPEDLPACVEEMRKLSEGQDTRNFTARFSTADGQYKVLQWTATPEADTGSVFAIARDITLESIRDEKIKTSENNLRTFFENAEGLMCTHDLQGRFRSVNSKGASTLGYTSEELCKKSLYDLIPPNHHDLTAAYLRDIALNKTSSGLMTILHKDGSPKILLFNNVVEMDGEGNKYVIANSIDVTEKHQLEQILKRTKRMLEQTNSVARIGGWDYDLLLNKVTWSEVTRQIHGVGLDYEPEPATGIEFYKREEHRDKLREAIHFAIMEGKSWDLELLITNVQGREIWTRSIGTAEFEDGKCRRIFGTFQDIDEKKTADVALQEEKSRLFAFVTHAPAAVAMFDKELRYIAASNRWIEEYHLEGQEIIGKSHYEVFPNITQKWKDIHAKSLKGAVLKKDFDIWRPDGWDADQCLRWEVRPWYNFDGAVGGIMMFTQDITESSRQKDELSKAKVLAEQASQAKSEFLANMSHEIRTPLNGIIGFTDLVLKTPLSSVQQQYLNIVNESANSLLTIINDILDFSKIESGKLELAIERCDLHQLASQSVDMIVYQANNKNLKVVLDVPSDIPRFIWADPVRLKQVLINLLSNAVKFTSQGEIELKIDTIGPVPQQNENTMFRFSVRDTGIGIQKDKQYKIFESFSQEDSSTTKRYGGTGLGLSISNQLLALMGSKLVVDSTPGKGSTFYFDLLLEAEAAPVMVINEPVQIKNTMQVKGSDKQIKVLIAEDNLINMLLAKTIVSRIAPNSEIHEASNGLECIEYCRTNTPDLILMDVQMPEMNGYEATRQLRQEDRLGKLPIIALTAGNVKGEREKCMDAGMNDFLTKPVVEEDIARIFRKWLPE